MVHTQGHKLKWVGWQFKAQFIIVPWVLASGLLGPWKMGSFTGFDFI